MDKVLVEPREYRLVMTGAISLGNIRRRSVASDIKILDGLYTDVGGRWNRSNPYQACTVLHWAGVDIDFTPKDPLLHMAKCATLIEKAARMPHLGQPTLRVLLREKTCLIASTEDAVSVRREWGADLKEQMAFFDKEERLQFHVVLMAFSKDLTPLRDYGDGLVDNVLEGRDFTDPRGRIAREDREAAAMLKEAAFMLMPEV